MKEDEAEKILLDFCRQMTKSTGAVWKIARYGWCGWWDADSQICRSFGFGDYLAIVVNGTGRLSVHGGSAALLEGLVKYLSGMNPDRDVGCMAGVSSVEELRLKLEICRT